MARVEPQRHRGKKILVMKQIKLLRCNLRGPGGERIADVVPGGTELEPPVETGSWAGRTHSQ